MLGRVDAVDLNGLTPERLAERAARPRERDAVLGATWSGQARLDGGQVELDVLRVDRFGRVLVVPDPLGLGVGLDEGEEGVASSGEGQVVERDLIDGENRAGRAVLGRHVADRGAGLQGEGLDPGTVGLDELADDAVLTQQL